MAILIGIDPSLTGTGIVILQNGEIKVAETTKNESKLSTLERVNLIRRQVEVYIAKIALGAPHKRPNLVVIEGFSYGSKGRSVFDIAYLGWRIREELEQYKALVPWIEVPPTQLKKFTTGKGSAGKEIMLQQVYKRWGVEFSDNNQCDAYALAKIGEAYLNPAGDELLPKHMREVIETLRESKLVKERKVRLCDD